MDSSSPPPATISAEELASLRAARSLLEIAPGFCGFVSLDGHLLDCNDRSVQAVEGSREALIGKIVWEGPWWAPMPHSVVRLRALFDAAAQGTRTKADLEYNSVKDGISSARWMELAAFPVRDRSGKIVRIACTGFDVTARIEARESLALHQRLLRRTELARNEELEQLFVAAPFFISRVEGPEHRFRMHNRAYAQLVGHRELIGKTVREAFPEIEGQGYHEMLERVYATGNSITHRERPISLQRTPGAPLETRYITFNYEPVRDGDGTIDGIVAYGIDVTDMVDSRHRTQLLAEQAQQLADQAMLADRRKDEFLAMLGHELRNPLAPIATAVKLMERKGDEKLKNEREVIARQVSHLSRLVDDLLDVSRIAQGKIELSREQVDIAELAMRAVEMASPIFEAKRQELRLEISSGRFFVHGDPVRLAQALANLLTNAGKYTPLGGHIRLAAQRDGNWVQITLTDDGIGIAAEFLPRVFDLFVQGARALNRAEGGLGLGLSVVKNLITLHGGEVRAKSAGVGLGSEFIVRLPAIEQARDGGKGKTPPSAPWPVAKRTRKILVVDDNVDATNMLSEALKSMGHQVACAHDGPQGLARQLSFAPEIAILDIGLPVMDGYELAAKMREASPHPLKLIALTGYGQSDDRRRTNDAGFDAHLVKPVDFRELGALLGAL